MPADFDTIVNLAKKRGFVFQSSEIYGGIRSAYDYGPLGAQLLRNVKDQWWRSMVQLRDDIVGIDSAVIQSPKVWVASGHLVWHQGFVHGAPRVQPHVPYAHGPGRER